MRSFDVRINTEIPPRYRINNNNVFLLFFIFTDLSTFSSFEKKNVIIRKTVGRRLYFILRAIIAATHNNNNIQIYGLLIRSSTNRAACGTSSNISYYMLYYRCGHVDRI